MYRTQQKQSDCPPPGGSPPPACWAPLAAATGLTLAPAEASAADAPAPSRVDALFNLEFSNEYLTPRGMIVQDKGLTVQPLVIGLVNLYKSDCFINSLTFVPGVWNDFASSPVRFTLRSGAVRKLAGSKSIPLLGYPWGSPKGSRWT